MIIINHVLSVSGEHELLEINLPEEFINTSIKKFKEMQLAENKAEKEEVSYLNKLVI